MKLFGEYLIEKQIISADALAMALVSQLKSLPSIAEIVFEKKLIPNPEILRIFKVQHEKHTGFVEAARVLGIWSETIQNEVDRHITTIRPPLGHILIQMGQASMDTINHALDEFLSEASAPEVSAPQPSTTEPPGAKPTQPKASQNPFTTYCDVFTQDRRKLLADSLALSKPGPAVEGRIKNAKDVLHILKGAARFVCADTSGGLITSAEDTLTCLQQQGVDKINPEVSKKLEELGNGVSELLWMFREEMVKGSKEENILGSAQTKKKYEDQMAAAEILRFDIGLL